MEWKSWSWGGGAASVESPAEHVERAKSRKHTPAEDASGRPLELWVVASAYEYVAAGTPCAKCGSPLGGDTRMLIDPDRVAAGGLVISTGCTGRRRHQYIATVTERSGDLIFGRFENRSNRRLRRNLRDVGTVLDSNWTGQPGDVA